MKIITSPRRALRRGRVAVRRRARRRRARSDAASWVGGSPRASIALYRTSQAMAAIRGHEFVLPDNVKRMVAPVLAHRLIVRPESRLRKVTAADIIEEILDDVPVPVIQKSRA